jgi:ubiquinone/menaquinone biosynthesis C-methylase UbiE
MSKDSTDHKNADAKSWNTLLAQPEKQNNELNKPYSLGKLWTIIHFKNVLQILHITCSKNPKPLLDIGCGAGWVAELTHNLNHEYIGIDLSKSFLKIANQRVKTKNLNAKVICADAENLPFKNQAFKFAFSYESLHHLPEPYKAVNEALRVAEAFTIGDEPAQQPVPIEYLTVNILKRLFGHCEPSGEESFRFNQRALKTAIEKRGYQVKVFRQFTFVPRIFTKYEYIRLVEVCFLRLYSILFLLCKPFSHAVTIQCTPKSGGKRF